MKYAYYPGCSAESTARDMHESSLAVAKALGIEMVEPKGWICCGATAGHQTDEVLAVSLPAASLVKVQDMGMDVLVNCTACYNRMKTANYKIVNNPDMRKKVSDTLERDYDGSVNVRHFMEVLLEDVGLERIKELIKRPLNGLKVASYYGCLLVRPHEITGFDDPENPTSLDKLAEAMGGEALDWPHKVECCGGGLSMSRTDVVIELTESIIGMAKAAGADCIVVCCPMCQINLDLRQQDIKKQMSKRYDMPILYITQLLGLCLGISSKKLGLSKLMVSPERIVKAISEVA
jgi:heterodisulfide reductase subunit B